MPNKGEDQLRMEFNAPLTQLMNLDDPNNVGFAMPDGRKIMIRIINVEPLPWSFGWIHVKARVVPTA